VSLFKKEEKITKINVEETHRKEAQKHRNRATKKLKASMG